MCYHIVLRHSETCVMSQGLIPRYNVGPRDWQNMFGLLSVRFFSIYSNYFCREEMRQGACLKTKQICVTEKIRNGYHPYIYGASPAWAESLQNSSR